MYKHEKLVAGLVIVCLGTLTALLLRPLQNTPFVDDWCYAWSVEWLLQHGELKILEWSAHANIVQVLWGWLFCLPTGFSFSALRLSTFVLALSSLCCLYALLRELNVSRQDAWIGTAALALNPVFFMLSFTYMSDVPFLAFVLWTCYAMVRALRGKNDGWLAMAVVTACLAAGTRVEGAVLPVAMAATLLLGPEKWGREKGRFVAGVVPLMFFGCLWLWWQHHTVVSADVSEVHSASAKNRLKLLQYTVPIFPRMLLLDIVATASVLGLACLPVTLAGAHGILLRRSLLVFAALVALLLLGLALGIRIPFPPLSEGSIWSLAELGGTERFLDDAAATAASPWWNWFTIPITLWSSAILLGSFLRRPGLPGEAFLRWYGLGHFLLMAILWLFHDRYALVLMPVAVVLFFAGNPSLRRPIAGGMIALFGVISVLGVHDHLRYNRAVWQGVEELRRIGAGDSEIDAGYVVGGWLQYAHPANLPRDAQGKDLIVGLTTKAHVLEYRLSNGVLAEGKLIKAIPYERWMGRSGHIYVYER